MRPSGSAAVAGPRQGPREGARLESLRLARVDLDRQLDAIDARGAPHAVEGGDRRDRQAAGARADGARRPRARDVADARRQDALGRAAPVVASEPDWEPFQPFPELAARESFVSGGPPRTGSGSPTSSDRAQPGLVGRAWFGPETQGPPGHAHGGAVSAVLDEALGAAGLGRRPPGRRRPALRRLPRDGAARHRRRLRGAGSTASSGRKVTTRGRLPRPTDGTARRGRGPLRDARRRALREVHGRTRAQRAARRRKKA